MGIELYNLDTDIGEKNNLAEQYPQKVKEMSLVGSNGAKRFHKIQNLNLKSVIELTIA